MSINEIVETVSNEEIQAAQQVAAEHLEYAGTGPQMIMIAFD